ncbi:MAG: hypothetical protein AAF329_03660 [Cyanobacteria bacterium P01_A01_bin.17]
MRLLFGNRNDSIGEAVQSIEAYQEPAKENKLNWGRVGQKSFLALLLIGNLTVSGMVMLLILANFAYTRSVAKKPAAALVQLDNGTSIAVEETANFERDPEVIRKFVTDSLIYLMNWSADLPYTEPTSKFDAQAVAPKDTGVEIELDDGFKKKVTTPAWQASFTLEEQFRAKFLQKLARMTPNDVFTGAKEVVLKVREVSYPEPEEGVQGAWSVDIVADLMIYSPEAPEGRAVSFNKRVYVQTIDVPPPPNPQTLTPLAAAIYSVRLSGLEITGMRDLQIQESSEE